MAITTIAIGAAKWTAWAVAEYGIKTAVTGGAKWALAMLLL